MSKFDFRPRLSPKTIAKETLNDCDVKNFPVSLKNICEYYNIYYMEDKLNRGDEGCSFREKDKYGIIINKDIKNEPRRKFTFAHEIGHVRLSHLKNIKRINCSAKDIEDFSNNESREKEANNFASELILPTQEILPYIKKSNIDIDLIKKISEKFGASLTASAVKIIEISDIPTILVMSKNKKVEWYFTSQDTNFKYLVPSGDLSEFTYAFELFEDNSEYKTEGEIDAEDWLEDRDNKVADLSSLKEQSVFLPNYNRVLTILTFLDPIC